MTREQFLDELKHALAGEVPASVLMDSLSYYSNYINDEVRSGRSEEEVIEELGKPTLIARSIIAAQTGERDADYEYTEDGHTRTVKHSTPRKHISFDLSGIMAKLTLLFVILLMILIVVFMIKVGLWVLVTFGIPILLILGIIYLIMYFAGDK